MHIKGLLERVMVRMSKLGECFGFYENTQGFILGCWEFGLPWCWVFPLFMMFVDHEGDIGKFSRSFGFELFL
jgi:hypothetical protein